MEQQLVLRKSCSAKRMVLVVHSLMLFKPNKHSRSCLKAKSLFFRKGFSSRNRAIRVFGAEHLGQACAGKAGRAGLGGSPKEGQLRAHREPQEPPREGGCFPWASLP